jgi:protein Mpv17
VTGAIQELIYNNLYTFIFGSATTPLVVAKKVLFDAFFHNALVCIPMAYATKALVFGYPIRKGIHQYIDDVRFHGLLLKYYAIWMPVNAMLFTIVPTHYRITVMAVISFFWMVILSTISSRARAEAVE